MRVRAYHGTGHDFEEFDRSHVRFNQDDGAFFFTSDKSLADVWSYEGNGDNPRVITADLNFENPLIVSADEDQTTWEKWDYSDGSLRKYAADHNKDGVIIKPHPSRSNEDTIYVVFSPSQIHQVNEDIEHLKRMLTL